MIARFIDKLTARLFEKSEERRRLRRQLAETQEALRFYHHALETDKWFRLHPLDKADALKKSGCLI